MRATDERLAALGELLAAGQTQAQALASLERVGGGAGVWARQLAATAQAGGLGAALAQQRALDADELKRIGGARGAGTATALAWVIHRRRTLRRRARALWAVLALPALLTLATAGATRVMALLLGAEGSLIGDLLPLAVVAAGIAVATLRPFGSLRSLFAGLPPFSFLRHHDAEAELAAVVAATPAPAEGFAAAAELVEEHRAASQTTAARLRDGAPLAEALPGATAVGEPLALRLAVGAADDTLRHTLRAHAEEMAARVTRSAAWIIRVAAYTVLLWVSLRSATQLTQIDLGPDRARQLNLEELHVDPKQRREAEELMRELGF